MNSSDNGPPGCPARQGQGTSISAADFTLVVHDCDTGPDGRAATTEVFGYFRLPGEEHDNDSLETASIVMPALSPLACLVHLAGADGILTRRAAAMLRSNVTRCPCTARAECPALNEASLLAAIEYAAGSEPHRQVT